LTRLPSRHLFGTLVIVAGVVDCGERCCRQLFDTGRSSCFSACGKPSFEVNVGDRIELEVLSL